MYYFPKVNYSAKKKIFLYFIYHLKINNSDSGARRVITGILIELRSILPSSTPKTVHSVVKLTCLDLVELNIKVLNL